MLHMLYSLFCKQKTAYEMRISDWSSDVCSSDLRRCVPWDDRADNADRFPNQQTDAWPGVKYVPFFKGKAAREIRVKIEQTDDRRGHKAGKAAHDAHFPCPDVRNLRPARRQPFADLTQIVRAFGRAHAGPRTMIESGRSEEHTS